MKDEAYIRAKERKRGYDVIPDKLKAALTLDEIDEALEEARTVNCLYIDEAINAKKRQGLMRRLREVIARLQENYNNLPNIPVWSKDDALALAGAIEGVDEVLSSLLFILL